MKQKKSYHISIGMHDITTYVNFENNLQTIIQHKKQILTEQGTYLRSKSGYPLHLNLQIHDSWNFTKHKKKPININPTKASNDPTG